jgi:molybdopterin-guanine dinucleotide biosynthesis protein A
MTTPLFGLILAGGASTRMQRDKATLQYHGRPQLERAYDLVSQVCAATFVSVRPDQRDEPTRAKFPQIVDRQPGLGPLAGISAALLEHPKAAWLVVACDLPFLDEATLGKLLEERDAVRIATAYRSAHDGLPEPLCAIWEPAAREAIQIHIAAGKQCPRKLLINADCKLIGLPDSRALDNVNTGEEFETASALLAEQERREETVAHTPPKTDVANGSRGTISLRVQYFAVLREQAGRSEEMIDSGATTAAQLYEQLKERHQFQLAPAQLKVAVNSEFSDWQVSLKHGDTVVFIPPVAGG